MNTTNKLLGIAIPHESKTDIRENIIKNIEHDKKFFHIVSVNSENSVLATENAEFRRVVGEAQMRIIDGVGVQFGAWIAGIRTGARYTGVDLMTDLLKEAHIRRLRVLLIGGEAKIAERVVECQNKIYPGIVFTATSGISNITQPTHAEENDVASIVTATKPHLVFVAYGSPAQELWIDRHSKLFEGMVVMGVGGAFDFLSGNVARAPHWIQRAGFEWLFRLICQPWRVVRQLRLAKFMWLVGKERLSF